MRRGPLLDGRNGCPLIPSCAGGIDTASPPFSKWELKEIGPDRGAHVVLQELRRRALAGPTGYRPPEAELRKNFSFVATDPVA